VARKRESVVHTLEDARVELRRAGDLSWSAREYLLTALIELMRRERTLGELAFGPWNAFFES
jgi:hypothetical protein